LPLRAVGRETFLRNKRAAGRPKDLADIAALEPALSRRSTDTKLKTRPCGAVVACERREPGPAILDA
jgi:hypothetical protein